MLHRSLAIYLPLILASSAVAAPVGQIPSSTMVAQPVVMSIDPVLGVSFQTNDSFTSGSTYLTLPLWGTLRKNGTLGGSLLFFQPQFTALEGGELAGSMGFGFRHFFNRQTAEDAANVQDAGLLTEGFYLGGNLFMDTLRTPADNQLWQMGVGLEAGTRYVTLRGNYYIPLTEKKRAGELVYGSVYESRYENHAPGYDYEYRSLYGSIETWGVYEEPMRGWDIEMALLVPKLDRYTEVQLLLGYQDLDADSGAFGSEIRGWKAGIEWRPVPAVALNATWYEDKRYRGADWIAGVRVEIPLGDREALKNAFKFRRRHLQERLTQPVERQTPAIEVARTAALERVDSVVDLTSSFHFSVPGFFTFEDRFNYHRERHHRFSDSPGIALDLMPVPGISYYSFWYASSAPGEAAMAAGAAAGGGVGAGSGPSGPGGGGGLPPSYGGTINVIDWVGVMSGSFETSSNSSTTP